MEISFHDFDFQPAKATFANHKVVSVNNKEGLQCRPLHDDDDHEEQQPHCLFWLLPEKQLGNTRRTPKTNPEAWKSFSHQSNSI